VRMERAGMLIFLLGVVLVLTGIILTLLGSPRASVSVGGCILIGPIPVCFGYGAEPLLLIIASAVALLVMLLVMYVLLAGLTSVGRLTHSPEA